MSFRDDALSDILNSRHFSHSSASKKGGRRQAFDPLAAVGSYEILCKADGSDSNAPSLMTIHGLNEDDSALIVSFAIGKAVEAMAILAGSRKVMKQIVDELESEPDQCSSLGEEEIVGVENQESEEEEEDLGKRRADNFEKNSFRNPKFWMCWRGTVRKDKDDTPIGEKNMGYLVWKSNRCEQFEGTISCDTLGWRNVKLKGHRIRKGAAECHLHWMDVKLSKEKRSWEQVS